MTLLDFARGPAMQWALIIFLVGVSFRLTGIFFFDRKKPLSAARGNARSAGYKAVLSRMVPHRVFRKRLGSAYLTSMVWAYRLRIRFVFLSATYPVLRGLAGGLVARSCQQHRHACRRPHPDPVVAGLRQEIQPPGPEAYFRGGGLCHLVRHGVAADHRTTRIGTSFVAV